jgi:preprotein translocase subunit SecG
MKTDTSMNLMLVVFCVVLIGFVLLNRKMNDSVNKKQVETDRHNEVIR